VRALLRARLGLHGAPQPAGSPGPTSADCANASGADNDAAKAKAPIEDFAERIFIGFVSSEKDLRGAVLTIATARRHLAPWRMNQSTGDARTKRRFNNGVADNG
jgi:hypothetical protein